MIDAADDIAIGCKQSICLDLFQSLRDRLLAKRTADLLQCIQSRVRGVLDKVYIGEATLGYQQHV